MSTEVAIRGHTLACFAPSVCIRGKVIQKQFLTGSMFYVITLPQKVVVLQNIDKQRSVLTYTPLKSFCLMLK